MEHRCYPRVQIALKVDIFKRDKLLGQALTKDISLGGILLQNCHSELSRNDVVTLKLGIEGEEHNVRCLVVHASQNNIGVMMIDMSKDTLQAIFNYLRENELPLRNAFDMYYKIQEE